MKKVQKSKADASLIVRRIGASAKLIKVETIDVKIKNLKFSFVFGYNLPSSLLR